MVFLIQALFLFLVQSLFIDSFEANRSEFIRFKNKFSKKYTNKIEEDKKFI